MKSIAHISKALLVCALFSTVMMTSVAAESKNLPIRTSPIPKTTEGVPHVQLGVKPNPDLSAELLARVSGIPDVEIRDTVISLPGAHGFWLGDNVTLVNPQVIVGGREFAHVHPDGSLHAALPPELAVKAVEAGWATPHPWANQREGWEGFVMIYTPSSEEELGVVFELILGSYNFVTGRDMSFQTR